MNLKKVYSPFISIAYGVYNFFAISTLAFLFISQKAWNPNGTKRKIRKTI